MILEFKKHKESRVFDNFMFWGLLIDSYRRKTGQTPYSGPVPSLPRPRFPVPSPTRHVPHPHLHVQPIMRGLL